MMRRWRLAVAAALFGVGALIVAAVPAGSPRPLASPTPDRGLGALYHVETSAINAAREADAVAAARIWWRRGNPAAAMALLERSSAPEAVRTLAEFALNTGQWSRAEAALVRLDQAEPATAAWAAMQLGALLAATRPDAARIPLERAASTSAYQVEAARLLTVLAVTSNPTRIGLTLAQMGWWPQAELAFASAPDDPLALALIALARARLGKPGQQQLEAALVFAPLDVQVQLVAGLVHRERGALEASRAALVAAAALAPDDPLVYAELGTAYQLLGDLVTAEYWLRYAETLSQGDAAIGARLEALRAEELSLAAALALMADAGVSPPSLESGR